MSFLGNVFFAINKIGLKWKKKIVMAVFHRLATRWLSRIEEDYLRSQVASYLAHTGGLCPEEDSVLRSGTTFHYAQDHAEQSRLKSLLRALS